MRQNNGEVCKPIPRNRGLMDRSLTDRWPPACADVGHRPAAQSTARSWPPLRVAGLRIAALLIAAAGGGCNGRVTPVPTVTPADAARVREAAEVVADAGDWPWWRGGLANGHADSTPPPTVWSSTENVRWEADVPGRGHASPVLVGQRVLLLTAEPGREIIELLAYDRATGKPAWRQTLFQGKLDHTHSKNTHASATPASDGAQIYSVFLAGGSVWAVASDVAGGNEVWKTKVGAFRSVHGYGASPILYKSLVIVMGDNPQGGFVAALDRASGRLVWQAPRGARGTYCTPLIVRAPEGDQLLIHGQREVVSYDPSSGAVRWRTRGPADTTANTPATDGVRVFATGGYPQQNVMAIALDGSGEVQWEQSLKVYVPSPLVVGDRLFLLQDNGVARCLSCATGEELWKKRIGRGFSASPVLAADLIYAADESGEVIVFREAERYTEVARNQLAGGGCFATPAIVDGQIFLRTESKLYCLAAPATDDGSSP